MKPYDYFLYAITLFSWSTSWIALRSQLGVVDPEVSVMWRFMLAAALMFVVTRVRGRPLLVPLREHYRPAALGLFIFSLNFSLYYYGGYHVSSGLLAVNFALASIVILFLDALWNRHAIRPAHIIAAITGVAGVGIVFAPEISISESAIVSLVLCFVGTVSFSIGSIFSASCQRAGFSVMTMNAWGMVYGVGYLFIWNLFRGHEFIFDPAPVYLGGLVWLAIVSSVVAFTAFLTLVGRIGAERAGYTTVVFPVFALMISAALEGYEWTLFAVLGLAMVMAGNWLILRK